jgi:shikimate dehydrogenase
VNSSSGNTTCWVIGDPIEHSLSPQMHTAGYLALGVCQSYTFLAQKVAPSGLADAILQVRRLGVKGVSVTMPHKESVIQYLDRIDVQAQKVGAVNTIVNQAGELVGYNTDTIGIELPIARYLKGTERLKGVVLGAGGAARSAIVALQNLQIDVTVVNRSLEKAIALSEQYQCSFKDAGDVSAIEQANVIVNTTPAGMLGNAVLSISEGSLNAGQIVFDAVYTPYWTPLLLSAAAAGATCIHGIEMFIQQGGIQFELYTGLPAPLAEMEKVVADALGISF